MNFYLLWGVRRQIDLSHKQNYIYFLGQRQQLRAIAKLQVT